MKTIQICILVLLLGFCFGHVSGQYQYNDLPYRPWSSFKGDTLAYLQYNYGNANTGNNTRKKSFEGKKISDLFDELELPVNCVVNSRIRSSMSENKKSVYSIDLGIHQVGIFPSVLIDCYIEVYFTEPLSRGIHLDLPPNAPWTPQIYEAIKDVELSCVGFNSLYHEGHVKKGLENQRKFYKEHYEELKGKKGHDLVRAADEIRRRERERRN